MSLKQSKLISLRSLAALVCAVSLSGLVSCNKNDTGSTGASATPEAPPLAAVADVVEDGTQDRVAQVSVVDGNVSLLPADGDDWEAVSLNQPVFEGYQVYADDDAHGELLVGDGKYARFADGAALTVSRLDPSFAQFELGSGTCELALDRYADDDYYEISAPGGAIVPQKAGSYRVDVLPDGTTRVIVTRGTAEITTPNGTFVANEGDVINLGDQPANVNVVSGGSNGYQDAFYDWSSERDTYYQNSYGYDVPQPVRQLEGRNDIYGVLGLAAYGVWQALDDHNDRYCWVPNDGRRADWSPYQDGYWDYAPVSGWNWVSHEQWGCAPYHYGRWDYNDRYGWAWSPYDDYRVVNVTPRYRWHPAEVYFWQPPNSNTYAWVPLAPGEAYYPYTTTLVTNTQVVAYQPRFWRERRAVYVVSPEQLELRERPRRADREFIARYDKLPANDIQVARLPKPQRLVGANEVARVRPNKDLLDRPVVVTKRSLEQPVKPATQRALARADRQIKRANDGKLNVDRQPLTAQNAPKVIRPGKGGNRGQNQVANGAQPGTIDRNTPAQARPGQPNAQNDRQAAKAQRQADRQAQQQQATQHQSQAQQQRQADRQARQQQRQAAGQQQAQQQQAAKAQGQAARQQQAQ